MRKINLTETLSVEKCVLFIYSYEFHLFHLQILHNIQTGRCYFVYFFVFERCSFFFALKYLVLWMYLCNILHPFSCLQLLYYSLMRWILDDFCEFRIISVSIFSLENWPEFVEWQNKYAMVSIELPVIFHFAIFIPTGSKNHFIWKEWTHPFFCCRFI